VLKLYTRSRFGSGTMWLHVQMENMRSLNSNGPFVDRSSMSMPIWVGVSPTATQSEPNRATVMKSLLPNCSGKSSVAVSFCHNDRFGSVSNCA